MMSMIEHVARALALADLDPESRRAVNLDAHMTHVRGHYGELARAAIEAMREPTDAMRHRVAADWGHRTWRQYGEVIDAALNEQVAG